MPITEILDSKYVIADLNLTQAQQIVEAQPGCFLLFKPEDPPNHLALVAAGLGPLLYQIQRKSISFKNEEFYSVDELVEWIFKKNWPSCKYPLTMPFDYVEAAFSNLKEVMLTKEQVPALQKIEAEKIINCNIKELTISGKSTLSYLFPSLIQALPHNFTIQELCIDEVTFSLDSIYTPQAIGGLSNSRLREIGFCRCEFSDEFFLLVAEALKNSKNLEKLFFVFKPVSSNQFDYLLEKLQHNKGIKEVDVMIDQLTPGNLQSIKNLCFNNQTLEVLKLNCSYKPDIGEAIIDFLTSEAHLFSQCRLRCIQFKGMDIDHPFLAANRKMTRQVTSLRDLCVSFFQNPTNIRKLINQQSPDSVTGEELALQQKKMESYLPPEVTNMIFGKN